MKFREKWKSQNGTEKEMNSIDPWLLFLMSLHHLHQLSTKLNTYFDYIYEIEVLVCVCVFKLPIPFHPSFHSIPGDNGKEQVQLKKPYFFKQKKDAKFRVIWIWIWYA